MRSRVWWLRDIRRLDAAELVGLLPRPCGLPGGSALGPRGGACPLGAAAGQQVLVGSGDELVRGVVVAQFAEAHAHRLLALGAVQVYAEVLKAPAGLVRGDRQHAEELIAAETDEQVVGAHVMSQSVGDAGEQLIPRGVALLIVDRLESVDVHKGGNERATFPPRALHLVLEFFEPDPSSPRAGQFVGCRLLELAHGLLAVLRGLLAVAGGLRAVAGPLLSVIGGATARRSGTRAELLQIQSVLVGDVLPGVQLRGVLVPG